MREPFVYKVYMFNFLYPPHARERAYTLYTQGYSIQHIAKVMHIEPEIVEVLLALYEEKHKYGKDTISAV
jgi:hypothetical protein